MKRTVAATVAVGALALSACTPTESGAKPEPAPVETVYVEAEPEPEPLSVTEDDEVMRIVLEMVWADTDTDSRESICWGVDTLGREFVEDLWDEQDAGIDAGVAVDFFEEKCS